jgi:hypothetical protein
MLTSGLYIRDGQGYTQTLPTDVQTTGAGSGFAAEYGAIQVAGIPVTSGTPFPTTPFPTSLAYKNIVSGVVGITSTDLVPSGTFSNFFMLQMPTTVTGHVWFNISGSGAVVGSGLYMTSGAPLMFGLNGLPLPQANVNAIYDGVSGFVMSITGG